MSVEEQVDGERAAAKVAQAQSRSVRLQRMLALVFVCLVGAAALGWYYVHVAQMIHAEPSTHKSARAAAASEMRLPALDWHPATVRAKRALPAEVQAAATPERGPDGVPRAAEQAFVAHTDMPRSSAAPAAARSNAPVVWRATSGDAPAPVRPAGSAALDALVALGAGASPPAAPAPSSTPPAGTFGDSLVPTVTTPVEAAIVPTRRWLLPKGSFLDCTLETAIDSTLPGMTTCVLAVDVFGADGRVVLLERGTKLVGETRGEVRAGQARVSVLWSEARTPTGVVVGLASPGTDALGRAGVAGSVDNHFVARFGAAVLLSMIDGAVSSLVARQQGSAGVVYNAQGSQDVVTVALRGTVGIQPTITVPPGARIQVLVARDIDFRSVYRLNARAGR